VHEALCSLFFAEERVTAAKSDGKRWPEHRVVFSSVRQVELGEMHVYTSVR
jgi:hypothetical protein